MHGSPLFLGVGHLKERRGGKSKGRQNPGTKGSSQPSPAVPADGEGIPVELAVPKLL